MSHTDDVVEVYWVAIRRERAKVTELFGPYLSHEAAVKRSELVFLNSFAAVSPVFMAHGSSDAEKRASSYV